MKVLLTGGAGYIGSHVANNLVDAGHKVHIIDNLITGNKVLIPKGADFTNCNIDDSKKIESLLTNNQFDILMHFAGFIQVEESVNFPEKYLDNNTTKAIKLFKLCKKNNLTKIIFSSTASVYGSGNNTNLISEENLLNPQNPYAFSKMKTEEFLKENEDSYKFIILRYFNVAGADKLLRAGQISKRSTHLIKILSEIAVGKRNFIEVYGNDYNTHDGTAIRDYIHVSDLADIHIEIAKYLLMHSNSQILNCGYGKGYSVLDVINEANKICNNSIKHKFTKRRKGDVEKLISNTNKIQKLINWEPKYDDLNTIIKSSIMWERKLNDKIL
tara:strand:- start:290 stop:1273 length:984 start_codon:yes stop_codon:yes gene_type:complete